MTKAFWGFVVGYVVLALTVAGTWVYFRRQQKKRQRRAEEAAARWAQTYGGKLRIVDTGGTRAVSRAATEPDEVRRVLLGLGLARTNERERVS